jgi:cell division protein FtsZ
MMGGSDEVPNVMTSRRSRTIQAMTDSGIDTLDIPGKRLPVLSTG